MPDSSPVSGPTASGPTASGPKGRPALTVAVVQVEASLDPAVNLAGLDRVAEVCVEAGTGRDRPDLVVFPEAYARDFGKPGTDLAEWAQPLDGPFVARVRELSEAHDVAVLAGMFESSPVGRPWNTLVLADRGRLTAYRKIHLYDSFGYRESDVLSPGPLEPVVVEVRGWRLGLMTCYDLRFPELSRLLVQREADALVVPAAWVAGERKVQHWSTLLTARAIEDLVYVVGAAQCGPRYSGTSTVVSPEGDVVATTGNEPTVITARLEKAVLERARRANPSLDNRRL